MVFKLVIKIKTSRVNIQRHADESYPQCLNSNNKRKYLSNFPFHSPDLKVKKCFSMSSAFAVKIILFKQIQSNYHCNDVICLLIIFFSRKRNKSCLFLLNIISVKCWRPSFLSYIVKLGESATLVVSP